MQLGEKFFQLTEHIETPYVLYDLDRITHNYSEIAAAFPNVAIHYAMKCNAEDRIIALLKTLGASFEVASQHEASQLVELNVDPDTIICMHPIKSPSFLSYLHTHNIRIMAVDSCEEVDKIAQYAPNSRLVVRIAVNNAGSLWNLNDKFGFSSAEVSHLFDHIRAKNLTLYGLTFQVGSQCESPANWVQALRACSQIWQEAKDAGHRLEFLSLGGGLPAQYARQVPTIAEIGRQVMRELEDNFSAFGSIRVAIEPGRSVVADAGILVSRVFGIATRGPVKWAYIETGTYNGLIEAIETSDRKFYPVVAQQKERPEYLYHIGGPSCVTLDTPFENVVLPELQIGDRLYILSAGAYTRVCATPFNGFPIPAVHYWQDVDPEESTQPERYTESISRCI